MAIAVEFDLTGVKTLLRALQSMPDVMRSRILVPAATNAGRKLERSIAGYIPVQQRGKKRGKGHYRDWMTNVVREYKGTQSVVVVVGAESGKAPHAVLVEKGTAERFTNAKTRYRKTGTKTITRIKKGRVVQQNVRDKVSVGSQLKRNRKASYNRGRMPAFHPVWRGVDSARGAITAGLITDITRGITAEFTASKLQRGIG